MKRIFFDTNVCGRIADSLQRGKILGCLGSQFTVWASTNTLMELLIGICKSDPRCFESHKERIRVAVGTDKPRQVRVLDSPLACAFQHGAGIRGPKAGVQKAKYDRLVRMVLAAKSLHQLLVEGVEFPNSIRVWSVQCDNIASDLETGKNFYASRLNQAKAEKLYFDEQRQWTIEMCRHAGNEIMPSRLQSMTTALDAVYRYQQCVWAMSIGGTFKPENNVNDWIDMNQLFHLADSSMHFLTEDAKIRERCRLSTQSERILILREYLQKNGLSL